VTQDWFTSTPHGDADDDADDARGIATTRARRRGCRRRDVDDARGRADADDAAARIGAEAACAARGGEEARRTRRFKSLPRRTAIDTGRVSSHVRLRSRDVRGVRAGDVAQGVGVVVWGRAAASATASHERGRLGDDGGFRRGFSLLGGVFA